MTDKYLLYGVEGSYYAAKVRCYLIKKNIPYQEILADRRAFNEVILPRVGYPIVPIVITPQNEVLQDTTVIIDTLEKRFPDKPLIPTNVAARFISQLIELYADEWFKIPALHYRWHYDSEFAIRMMGENNDPAAPLEKQRQIGQKIASGFSSWPKHLGVDAQTQHAVEQLFASYLRQLNELLADNRYLLGDEPSLGDCALMGPLYAHIYRDPYSGAMIRRLAPSVCAWIERMRETSKTREDAQNDADGLPAILFTLLRNIARDYVPMASTAIQTADNYLTTNPPTTEALPRYLGKHAFVIGRGENFEAAGTRSVHTVEIWKVQRLLLQYRALSAAEKALVNDVADAAGVASLLNLTWKYSVHHHAFRFHGNALD